MFNSIKTKINLALGSLFAGVLFSSYLFANNDPEPLDPNPYIDAVEIDDSYSIECLPRKPDISTFDDKLVKILKAEGRLQENLSERSIDMIVVHTTEHGGGDYKRNLRNLKKGMKTHYMIDRKGGIYEICRPEYKANAVGNSMWDGLHELNYNSISVELRANMITSVPRRMPVTKPQYMSLGKLVDHLKQVYPIERVLGHNQVSVHYFWQISDRAERRQWQDFVVMPFMYRQRKSDPGKKFHWDKVLEEDPYDIIDPDILRGRVKNNLFRPELILRGQRKAEEMYDALPDT